jgi:hypothetical protein
MCVISIDFPRSLEANSGRIPRNMPPSSSSLMLSTDVPDHLSMQSMLTSGMGSVVCYSATYGRFSAEIVLGIALSVHFNNR